MKQRSIGTILSYVYMVLHAVINILYVPILLNIIGRNEYGLYQVVGSIISYFTVMESSLSAGVLRFYCKYKVLNDEYSMENTLAISRRIYYFLSCLAILLGIFGTVFLHFFYHSSFSENELLESEWMFVVLILNLIIDLTNYVYVAIINGNEEFVFIKSLGIISMVLQPVCVILAIKRFPYALVVVVCEFVINLIVAFVRRWYAIHKIGAKIIYHKKDLQFVKEIVTFSSEILLAGIADQIFWKTDQLIIGKVYGTSLVAVYSVGSQIYTNYMPVGTAITGVFMPYISELNNHKNKEQEVSALFIKVGRISCFMLLMVLTGFILFGKEFIHIWVGNGYGASYYVALVVMIPFTIDLVQNLALTILQVFNKYSFRAKMYFVVALLNIGLTILLVFKYGIVGAALATGISMFICSGIIMNIYYSRIGLDVIGFWKNLLPFVLLCIPISLVGFVIGKIQLENGLIQFILHVLLYIVVYILTMYIFAFNDFEKNLVRRAVRKLIRK